MIFCYLTAFSQELNKRNMAAAAAADVRLLPLTTVITSVVFFSDVPELFNNSLSYI